MAQPTTAKFGKMLVLLGDGVSPETFAAPCGFSSKNLTFTKGLTEINLPDCIDPDAPSNVGRDVENLSAAITGEGVLAAESIDEWIAAYESTTAVNVKITIEIGIFTHTWTGAMHVSEWALGAEQGGRVTSAITMASDGELIHSVAST